MRVLIYPHVLEIGGAQLNAIEIAGALRDQGHDVIVFGQPGALTTRIDELGLEFVAAPEPGRRPSLGVVRALRELIDTRGIEIVHGHEWPPALECLWAAHGRADVTAVATVASMAIAPFIPRTMPILVGTEQIEAVERRAGRTQVGLLEPPVDVVANRPDLDIDHDAVRQRWGLDPNRKIVTCVSRLAHELKLEGILAAMDAVAEVSRTVPVQLLLGGDGPASDVVQAKADEVNRRAGAGTVIRTGELVDPRPAYAVADVAFGMGASALRAMAFAKPLVVQGENGFWRLLTPDTLDNFLWTGWYGYGDDAAAGADRLRDILLDLLTHPEQLAAVGQFGRSVVVDRYSVVRIAEIQSEFYERARAAEGTRTLGATVAAGLRFGRYHLGRRAKRAIGRRSRDDFNARPVARTERATRSAAADPGRLAPTAARTDSNR